MKTRARPLGDVCVAQINNIEKHPNADRLSVCEITDGQNRYGVVCGADNMKEGDKVAFRQGGNSSSPYIEVPRRRQDKAF